MIQLIFSQRVFFVITLALFSASSCGVARYQKDMLRYVRNQSGPDMGVGASAAVGGSGSVKATDHGETPTGYAASAADITSPQADTEAVSQDAMSGQMQGSRMVDEPVIIPEAAATESLQADLQRNAVAHHLPSAGGVQEKAMKKLTARMERKLRKQGNEIDFRNNTPLELFLMIMSGAGLVLGIFGIGLGWFVFIVAGGIWLYYKLVVNKQ